MPWYGTFLLGILSGIITSLFVKLMLDSFEHFRKIIPPKLRKSFDCEFKNQKQAEKSILKDAKNSNFMYVFAMKGGSFCAPPTDETNRGLTEIFKWDLEQRYLISALDNPYLEVRKKELTDGIALDEGIRTSYKYLINGCKDPTRHIRFSMHKEVVRFRLIIFDQALYISFQPKDKRGITSPMQRYLRESSGYIALKAFFDEKWEEYKKEEYKKDD